MNLRKLIKNLITYPSLPDFYILGAQKAGTTSLDSYLKYHPELRGSHPKEIHFFDNKEVFQNGFSWYKNHFRRYYLGKRKLYFESTPNYLFNKTLPSKLRAVKPQLKFIIILRDPIERAFSAYNMFRNNYLAQKEKGEFHQKHLQQYERNGEFMSFEAMIDEELRHIASGEELAEWDESFTLLRKGLYRKQIEHWQAFFPKERFLILQFEDLKKDETQVLNQISRFLGIQNFDHIEIDKKPRNKREYDATISEETRKKMEEFYKENN